MINSLRTGGAEHLLTDLLPALAEWGEHVELLLLNGVKTPFYEEIRRRGIMIHTMSQKGGEYNPIVIYKLRRYVCSYDVIHVHLFPAQYWVAWAHCLWRGKGRLVTTEHNTYNRRCKYHLTSWLDRKVYSFYDAIVCISRATLDFMKGRVENTETLCVVVNGIRTKEFRNQKPPEDEAVRCLKNCFVLMQVARFQEQKNQDCVIRALAFLPQCVHAVFVGEGERLEVCRRLAWDLGVSDRVHFLGNRSDVPRLWAVADVGVMSSHWEGFGLAAVEGMAAGKPVIVSRVPGLSDVVKDGRLQFEPDNARDLADKVLSLYAHPDFRREMSEKAVAVARQYDLSVMVDGYRMIYEKIVGG